MGGHRVRSAIALVVFVALASACGARVSEQQIQAAGTAAGQGTSTGLAAGTREEAAIAEPSVVPGEPVAAETTEAPGAVEAAGEAPAPGAPEQGAPAPAPGAPAPDGGNGGATDVGVTATEVLLGNVSTLSGPVPGLFQGAVTGARGGGRVPERPGRPLRPEVQAPGA